MKTMSSDHRLCDQYLPSQTWNRPGIFIEDIRTDYLTELKSKINYDQSQVLGMHNVRSNSRLC